MGGGGGQKSGGGAGGKQSWSSYMEKFHEAMLRGSYLDEGGDYESGLRSTNPDDYSTEDEYLSVMRDVLEAHETSPFSGETAYDPATRLTAMGTAVGNFRTAVGLLDEDGDWEGAFDTAEARVEETLTEEHLQGYVDSFDGLMSSPMINAFHRLYAAAADANASNSSAFILARAMLEREHLKDVAKFGQDLTFQGYKDKLTMIQNGVSAILQQLAHKYEMKRLVMTSEIEAERMGIIAEKEQSIREVELAVRDVQWELEVWQYAANILAGISGAIGSPTHAMGRETEGASGLASGLGGAMSGAAAGAMVGGPWGAAIGGVIGGVGGYLSA
jgi:hypothetical protein